MCGKPNVEEAQQCEFCQARLKPPGWKPEQESPTWLMDLKTGESSPLPEPQKDAEPLWLSELRSGMPADPAELGDESENKIELPTQEITPDWIKGLEEEKAAPPSSSPMEDGDWLGSLRNVNSYDHEVPLEPPPLKAPSTPGESEGELGENWMDRLSSWQSETGDRSPAAGAFNESKTEPAQSEWNSPFLPSAESQSAAQPVEDLPDWLNPMPPVEKDSGENTLLPTKTPDGQVLPDWLGNSVPEEIPDEPPAAPGLPDWLSNFSEDLGVADSGSDPVPVENMPFVGENLPDWMTSSAEEPDIPALPSQLPDWLDGLSPEENVADHLNLPGETLPAEPFTGAVPLENDQSLPDWLKGLEPETGARPAEQEERPAWLAPLSIDQEVERPTLPESEELLQEDVFGHQLAAEEPVGEDEKAAAPGEKVQPPVMPFKTENLPDWLNASEGDAAPQQTGPYTSPFVTENLPEWLSDYHEEIKEPVRQSADADETFPGKSGEHPFTEEGLPDWFHEDQAEPGEKPVGEMPAALESGALPSWLAAMRPVEAISLGTGEVVDDRKVESSGPLAGLRSVLPFEDAVLQYSKPPVYSFKLQVNEKQRVQATLLETMLEEEALPAQQKRASTAAGWRLPRLIMGILLLIMVAVPLFFAPAGGALEPVLSQPAGVLASYAIIDQLPADAPVLIGLDFRAGYAGELRLAASGLITQLMQKQARLVLISTDAATPVLGEMLVDDSAASPSLDESLRTGYVERTQAVNLGYLPGGTASLQEFALRPQQAVSFGLMTPLDGYILWSLPILKDVNQLSDFALLVVVTDQIEGGQAWIEQVQPHLGNIPMILVSSAQAAPMLEPYALSGQVQGLVKGLPGGLAFEQVSAQGGSRASTWAAYQSGLIFAVLVLLAGALFQGVTALLQKGKAGKA
jgi:hypothetical protein